MTLRQAAGAGRRQRRAGWSDGRGTATRGLPAPPCAPSCYTGPRVQGRTRWVPGARAGGPHGLPKLADFSWELLGPCALGASGDKWILPVHLGPWSGRGLPEPSQSQATDRTRALAPPPPGSAQPLCIPEQRGAGRTGGLSACALPGSQPSRDTGATLPPAPCVPQCSLTVQKCASSVDPHRPLGEGTCRREDKGFGEILRKRSELGS